MGSMLVHRHVYMLIAQHAALGNAWLRSRLAYLCHFLHGMHARPEFERLAARQGSEPRVFSALAAARTCRLCGAACITGYRRQIPQCRHNLSIHLKLCLPQRWHTAWQAAGAANL
eukprot:5851961-Pleurochrysis_carterae.AAC.6